MPTLTAAELQIIALSLRVALVSMMCSLPLAIVVAYGLARLDFPGKTLVDAIVHLPLVLPPVRDRSREDRLDLITRILADLKTQLPGCPTECTTDAVDRLLAAPWHGNVRELRNVLECAMILGRGQPAIGFEQLPPDLRQRSATDRRYQAQSLSEVERQHIERTLRHHGGNRTRAALELGISRATLINKIKQYRMAI